MGKSFYMGGAWAEHERRIRQEDSRYEAYRGLPQETQSAGGKSRQRVMASVAGFDSKDFHYKGDLVNILREEPVNGGDDVEVTFQRRDPSTGKSRGTMVATLRKTSDGRIQTIGPARRTFSF